MRFGRAGFHDNILERLLALVEAYVATSDPGERDASNDFRPLPQQVVAPRD